MPLDAHCSQSAGTKHAQPYGPMSPLFLLHSSLTSVSLISHPPQAVEGRVEAAEAAAAAARREAVSFSAACSDAGSARAALEAALQVCCMLAPPTACLPLHVSYSSCVSPHLRNPH